MTDEAMSPLRRRMIEDMTIRKFAPKTQQGCIRTVKDFAMFLGRSPATANFEDVRRFQLQLAANDARTPILNHTVAALRFLFRVTLKRYDIIEHTAFIRHQCRQHQCQRTANTRASLPLLRRPHDHHRDLPARQLAQISSAAGTRNQDRYLMTRAPKPRRRKATCLLRWFQTGHDGARRNLASTLPLSRQPSTVDPAILLESKSLPPVNHRNRRHRSRCPHSTCRSVALKSP